MSDKQFFFVYCGKGGPGTGKATSCRKLEEHGFKTISMNQVIDEEVKSGTELGNKMKDYVLSHSIVPLVRQRFLQLRVGVGLKVGS